ncbi:MAG TPA: MmcQ/YjbR family DNA-binding protein [Candidatus Eremiobacteraceae bacterium]|nr:MmcQ/YjbR family DNA-binding protein [Candidatus Eremiobacteraceae bacterium]
MATWRDVRRLALALPGASESRSREHAAWLVKDKFFVWERPLRKSDLEALGPSAPKGPILGVRTAGLEMKEALIASKPRIYFTTPHFDGYPAVLVRLDKIGVKELKDLILEAWFARAPKKTVEAYLGSQVPRADRRPKK